MHLIRVGLDAVLVEVADGLEAAALAGWLRPRIDAVDIVPAARTVLIDGVAGPGFVEDLLAGWSGSAATHAERSVEVPVTYDGPDLAAVAAAWGVGIDEVAARHAEARWVSAFCGFAPGFAYLAVEGSPLPEVPRRDTPRARVPPGSVALAGPHTGIYPTASPGGWQVIGHTDVTLWDADREEPALLAPGTRVRFTPA